jgi:RNA polymerase sigma factor (sigma-70 family)
MELTEDIYKKLWNYAMQITFNNEDDSADCVCHVVTNYDKFDPSKASFNTWAYTTIRNRKNDLYRSRNNNPVYFNSDSFEHLTNIISEEQKVDDIDLKSILTKEEYAFCISYIKNPLTKTSQEKVKFFRIKNKALETYNKQNG